MTGRWISPLLSLVLLGTVLLGGSSASSAPASPRRLVASAAPACPLTRSQETAAVLAFEEMMPVIRHPRCTNCHGGVNPFKPQADGGHVGGEMDVPEKPEQCQECHSELPGWTVTGPAMFCPGRSSKKICMTFKEFKKTGAEFVDHMQRDGGSIEFIKAAFIGERALDEASKDYAADKTGRPFVAEKPPGTQALLAAQAQAWVNLVGKGYQATPECGCEIHRDGWVGTASFIMKVPGNSYSVEETAFATVWFELDDSLSKGVEDEYWKSTAGSIHWTTKYSGECVGTFSGTTPIGATASGRGGDGNPLGVIELTPRAGQVRYFVSTAPWQEFCYPMTSVPCGAAPALQVALPLHASFWWQHDPKGEVVSSDGMQLAGSYQMRAGQGTLTWNWSFRRTRP